MTSLAEGFLVGAIVTSSVVAGLFFFKFWRRTRDTLFLAFAIAFVIEGLNRVSLLFVAHPNEANPLFYVVRLFAFVLILAGILKKNYGR